MLTGLYNAIMQIIFIVTGLVSIRSLTDMITQLVGQGDALKDGEETAKEVRKRVGQTAAVGAMGAGVALGGVGAAVAGAKLLGGAAKDMGGKVTSKVSDYIGGTRTGKYVNSRIQNLRFVG